jgi:hypothetical protein
VRELARWHFFFWELFVHGKGGLDKSRRKSIQVHGGHQLGKIEEGEKGAKLALGKKNKRRHYFFLSFFLSFI